jgi:hypothetical protein
MSWVIPFFARVERFRDEEKAAAARGLGFSGDG